MGEDPLVVELAAACVGEVRDRVELSGATTLRVGGPTRVLVTAEVDGDLAAVGRACATHGVPWLVVGRGSNLIVADEGWSGVAVELGRGYRGVEVGLRGSDGATRVVAGAAEPMPTLAVRIADAGLAGFAWGAGVPGTLGGSVRMNAGAHGGEMSDHLVEVDLVRMASGTRETWPAAMLRLGYRSSELPADAVVVAATMAFPTGTPEQLREQIAEVRAWRREHQPINEPNCGSVFTNPPGDSAGRLIDAAGGKTLAVGGARVSSLHANFITAAPDATAADVIALIRLVQDRVEEVHGVRLEPEVVVVGGAP